MKKVILIGIPPKEHVILAMDEFKGLKELGNECHTVVYTRNKWNATTLDRIYGVLINAINVLKMLYRVKPDILYLNSRVNSLGIVRDFISLLLFRFLYWGKLKIIIKSHGSDTSFMEGNSFYYKCIIAPFVSSQVDAYLMLSQEEKKNLLYYFPGLKGKVYVTYNIIDPSRSTKSDNFKKSNGLDENKFNFLFIGRMVRDKGVYSILKAIPYFDGRDDAMFTMVGSGEELENLKILATELNIEKYVKFTGYIDEIECDHFFANCDALVFPSLDEGFSMVLFKSISSGLPVITTRIRAAKDQLNEPENCLWVDGNSELSVAKALNAIYDNHELRNRMEVNNKHLGKKYSKESVCKNMDQVFGKILD
ncbi:glycosyltransferase family 4 protein [Maribacter sp. SA7]|uniref:glycosyltransferase family 4 protein n=1 Tax=Maribacter zhoushanensis TaxID=3030012 RepID=UPI0023ED908B|nr:glycosyltransferase family 4 protein [Maribacter zhoushanensis]MDF4201836.1 glycosyltransferase family 4 protein [Maribacter zhoushanensis]